MLDRMYPMLSQLVRLTGMLDKVGATLANVVVLSAIYKLVTDICS